MATKVEIIAKEIIKPSSPAPPNLKHHKLSLLDREQFPFPIPLILFYQQKAYLSSQDSSTDQTQIRNQLKRSLSDALTKFYPLAGKVNGEGRFVDSISDSDSGPLFVEAEVCAPLSQAIEMISNANLEQYLPIKSYMTTDILLAVQISFFECGGFAIGACISHQLADCSSFLTFLDAWAVTCRGETSQIVVQPNFDVGCQCFPPVANVPRPWKEETFQNAFAKLVEEKPMLNRLLFDKEKLLKLKALTIADVKDPSRVEVVSAYICKKLVEINRAKADAGHKIWFAFLQSVNLRSRFRQLGLLSDEFAYGNFAHVSPSTLLAHERVENFHDLVSVMRSVLRKYQQCDDVESLKIKLGSAFDEFKALLSNPEVFLINISSWCKYPVYELDYGWGRPVMVCPQPLPVKNSVILMDAKDGEGIEAWLVLAEEDMRKLESELFSL